MIKKLLFSLIIVVISLIYYQNNISLAYDDQTTHPALTDEIVDFYNLSFSNNQLTAQEKEWVVEGAILEDAPPRWINHFYDPIYKVGWSGEKAGNVSPSWMIRLATAGIFMENPISAVSWVNNNLIQERYSRYGGDRTWKKGLEYYANGNKEEAYKILGHILHLLEDQSVPDHTRNDTHAHDLESITGDFGSPYEEYLKKYNRQTIKELDLPNKLKAENKQPIVKQSIEDYLISLATYSNNYFFSKDTINDPKYENPKITRDDGEFGYGKDESGKEFLLARVWITKIDKTFILDKNDFDIVNQYFSRLSRQAVLHGAGVVNLFRQQAEDAIVNKDYPAHLIKYDTSKFNIPAISFVPAVIKLYGMYNSAASFTAQTISSAENLFSDIFGNSQPAFVDNTQNEYSDGQENAILAADDGNNISDKNPIKKKSAKKKNKKEIKIEDAAENINSDKNNQLALDNQEEIQQEENQNQQIATTTQKTNQQTINNQQQTIAKQCSFSASQSPSHKNIIINEAAWMGTTESSSNEWVELKNISNQEINLSGYQLIDKDEQIKITFENSDKIPANNFYLLERTDDNSVSGISANKIYVGALSNINEGLRLFDNQCNLIDEVLASSSWPAGDSSQKRTMERDLDYSSGGFNWHTSSVINGTPKKENSAAYYAGGGGGSVSSSNGNSSSSNNSTGSSSAKILINEIQITGGSGKTDYDFIELYNPNNFEVNLNGYRLVKRTQTGTSDASIKSWTSDATIPANGYYLWANSAYNDISVAPDITTSATISSDNGIAIRYGAEDTGEIIDSVGWGANQSVFAEGSAFSRNPGANESLQRKSFVDTGNNANDFEILACPSPNNSKNQAQSANCQSSQGNSINHLVISEMQIAGNAADDEFIEIYNPTDQIISLADYSIQYLSGTATSTDKISSSNTKKNFSNAAQIAPKGFFLLVNSNATSSIKDKADMIYSAFSLSGSASGASIFLTSTSTPISGINDAAIIDSLSYDSPALATSSTISVAPSANGSLERKSFSTSTVDSMVSGEHKFSGNGYDADNANDFILRTAAEPQNSQNFPEPRNSPTMPQNFSVQYSSSTMSLNFSWQESQDYNGATSTIDYKIMDISNSSSTLSDITATSTSASVGIDEIGRDYQFSLQAFDKEGLNSASSTALIFVPSFLSSVYFYQDPRTASSTYLIDLNWNNYPFVPSKSVSNYDSWKVAVFYLNKDADKVSEFGDWDWGNSANSAVKLNYKNCASSNTISPALILPDNLGRCSSDYGGIRNSSLSWAQLEDPHLMVGLESLAPAPTTGDYLTIAFYTYGGFNNQVLVAVDKTKYYFQNEAPARQSPSVPQNISLVSYDPTSKDFMFSLNSATDVDSIDQNLSYLASFSTSTNFSQWENLGWYIKPFQTKVQANIGDKIAIKVKDDFNNFSPTKIITLIENNGEYGISVEDAQSPIDNFQEIILTEQINDGLSATKYFNYGEPYGFIQEFTPQTSGYLSRVEVKAARLIYDAGFTIKIKDKENNQIIDSGNNVIALFSANAANASVSFRKTPFLEAGKTYKLIFETGPDVVALYGDGANIYYKIYGLTQ